MSNLTNKEIFLLEGEKYQHQLAIDKYNNFIIQSHDVTLKNLFSNLVKIEEEHLNLINLMIQGEVPKINQNNIHPYYNDTINSNNDYININNITLTSLNEDPGYEDGDKIICFDALTTEELLFSTLSSSSLQFENTEFKSVFEHIINEKSYNLKYINDYMTRKGMHNNIIYF